MPQFAHVARRPQPVPHGRRDQPRRLPRTSQPVAFNPDSNTWASLGDVAARILARLDEARR